MIMFPDSLSPSDISPAFALWATHWLAGDVSADDFLDEARDGLYIADMALWARIREHLNEHPSVQPDAPRDSPSPIRLILGGAGHAAPLPDGLYVAGAADAGLWRISTGSCEHMPEAQLPLVPPAQPGDALYDMGVAAERASMMISAAGFRSIQANPAWNAIDVPGPPVARDLPPGVPQRVLQIFARAAALEDIVSVVREHAGDASLDPMLLPLGAAIRSGYAAAVDASVRELFIGVG